MSVTAVPPLRLVLIDDSAPFRQVLARLLRVAGHTVWEAETGAAGLALLRQHPLDLVVTDRDMPRLTGWDVARLAKTTHPHLPVVLVTGGGGCAAAEQRTPPLVDAILWKPFPFAELLAVIGRLTLGAPAARSGAPDGPETGSTETQFHRATHTLSAPIGTAAAPSHLGRCLASTPGRPPERGGGEPADRGTARCQQPSGWPISAVSLAFPNPEEERLHVS